MNKKIEKMVAAYNKYAIKHGYPDSTIQVDYVKKEVIGTFTQEMRIRITVSGDTLRM